MTTLKNNFQDQLSSDNNSLALKVLHLVGSAVSDFYFKLSVLYATEVVQPAGVAPYFAVVHPDGLWQLGSSLDNLGKKIAFQDAISQLPQIDVVVPHMFCFPGMTSYRSLFEDILNIPVVGTSANSIALATSKSHTRNIVSPEGVRVAQAQLLRAGETLEMKPPFVVKPNSEDNSVGITLVREESEIALAIETGFKYDEVLLIEEYIPGRELRVGVLELDGKLKVLPALEYLLTPENPIRTLDNKLGAGDDGKLVQKLPNRPLEISCPAHVNLEVELKLNQAVKNAHQALGCRDYSLYDFRIHKDTQEPYMLESCSFWSFTATSVLSKMLEADGRNLEQTAWEIWCQSAQRTRIACGSLFKQGIYDNS